ncbi:hypothetical protein [Rhizobium laguerreae]|nr:hypothetical protein [Rhizobium laguerreae]
MSSADGFVPFSSDLGETWIELGLDTHNYAWSGKLGLTVNW